jgi:hypothetical protein
VGAWLAVCGGEVEDGIGEVQQRSAGVYVAFWPESFPRTITERRQTVGTSTQCPAKTRSHGWAYLSMLTRSSR